MRLSAICFYLVLVSSGEYCRSLLSQPDCCFLNSAGWSWWGVFHSDLWQFYVIDWLMIILRINWKCQLWLNILSCPSSSAPGAAWGSAHSGGVSWWRGHSSRGLPPSPWHPSAVRPTSPRRRSHSRCTGKTTHTHTQAQTPPSSCTRVHKHRLFLTG